MFGTKTDETTKTRKDELDRRVKELEGQLERQAIESTNLRVGSLVRLATGDGPLMVIREIIAIHNGRVEFVCRWYCSEGGTGFNEWRGDALSFDRPGFFSSTFFANELTQCGPQPGRVRPRVDR